MRKGKPENEGWEDLEGGEHNQQQKAQENKQKHDLEL